MMNIFHLMSTRKWSLIFKINIVYDDVREYFPYLAGILSNIAMNSHVIFQKFDLSKAMATHGTNMLLFIIRVMCLHVQRKVLLSIELFSTFLA